jgi:hypothetical protein
MAMSNAEKQAAFRQRRDARIREIEDQLRNQGAVHSEAPKAVLDADEREEIAGLRAELAAMRRTESLALAAIKMLKASNKKLRNQAPADRKVIVMTRADRLAIVKALHPDASPDQAAKTKALQLFNALPILDLEDE